MCSIRATPTPRACHPVPCLECTTVALYMHGNRDVSRIRAVCIVLPNEDRRTLFGCRACDSLGVVGWSGIRHPASLNFQPIDVSVPRRPTPPPRPAPTHVYDRECRCVSGFPLLWSLLPRGWHRRNCIRSFGYHDFLFTVTVSERAFRLEGLYYHI